MDILSRIIDSKTTIDYLSVLNSRIEELLSPIVFNPSAINYSEYISSLGYYIHSRARDIIRETLEEMDDYFFKLEGRTLRYYSKSYRKREIITVFGHIIYYRHEYIDRSTGKPFIYVDEKIGLHRKDRYDPTVCSLIFERYSDNNSMIKTGKDIGTALNSPFSLNEDRLLEAIPRQTVWKILHRFKRIDMPIKQLDTPKTLYVMADEKYISAQRSNTNSLMTKEVIIHEGIKAVYKSINPETGEVYIRNKLINPHRIISYNEEIYDEVNDYINEAYNIDEINTVYLMGDGGSWIFNGQYKLSSYSYKVKCGLDKLHFVLAVNTISKDDIYKSLLYNYSIHNDRKDFKYLIDIIIKQNESRKEMIQEKANYILNQMPNIKTMYKEIKIGCAMEQAVSHDIASQFSSIPKAYSNKWLPFYLNLRQNYLNGYDIRKAYIIASDKASQKSEHNEISLKESLNTSFFDNQIKNETYSITKKPSISINRH